MNWSLAFGINIAIYLSSLQRGCANNQQYIIKSLTGGKNMTLKKLNRNQKGFTLIEISLIVIAIIGILAVDRNSQLHIVS